MTIVDKEIRQVMAPPGIGEKDQQEQYDLIPDILSAPGMLANPRSIGNSDGDNARDFLMRMDNPSAPERVVARDNTFTTDLNTECGTRWTVKQLTLLFT